MKSIFILITFFVLVRGEFIRNSSYELIPYSDGTFYLANASEVEELSDLIQNLEQLEVSFTLFTKRNPNQGQIIPLYDRSALLRSNFNARNPTRIITHGWRSSGNSNLGVLLRNAYFQRGDYNVIIVDWSSVAHSENYVAVKSHVENVGKIIAQFIDFLNSNGGMSFGTLYLIGHSLGAHASGFAGKYVTRGRINTIFGLDPAHPLFDINSPGKRLDANDAQYVETIHTNGNKLGIFNPIGTTSFYPNGGKKQPGCGMDITGKCSHSRSYELFAESVQNLNHFHAIGCRNFDEVKSNKCSQKSVNVRMGGEPSNNGRVNGIYYVPTNSKPPYSVY